VSVFHAAEATGLHPFLICVGSEEEPCRIRRAVFPYDGGYRACITAKPPTPKIRSPINNTIARTAMAA
jgi:hypothetical protein